MARLEDCLVIDESSLVSRTLTNVNIRADEFQIVTSSRDSDSLCFLDFTIDHNVTSLSEMLACYSLPKGQLIPPESV